MKFKKNTRRKAIDYEKDLIVYWKKNNIFELSINQRPEEDSYVFYDGPPFITGVPHHGTLLSSVVKDAIPRYWTMKGRRVERVWGWDCHGLPAEVFTEKKLGIHDKRDIGTKISLDEYINTCRTNMVQTGSLWEDTIDRIGRWVNFKGAYRTMDKEFMESVWWAFKTLYDKGKIYEGEKVLLYCTRDATPISKAEVAMDNSYQDVTDPSVYVKFKLLSGELVINQISDQKNLGDVFLLAWTTTPWTLNANTAVVVGKDIDYSLVEVSGEQLIIASRLVQKVLTNEKHEALDYRVIKTFKGSSITGAAYEPLFVHRGENAHKVWHADFVTDEEGTGIAHQAPSYGEDDYNFAKANKIPFVLDTDEEGFYEEGPWKGKQIWQHNKQIAKDLKEQKIVWKIDYIRHEYPHCHRCGTKLQYRAHPSWFMDIDSQKTELLQQNTHIEWFPEYIKHGRFEKTIEAAPDWNISRDRFWATAMPVWKGTDTNGETFVKVIGSYKELEELSGVVLEDYHRPWIDDVTFTIDGVTYRRVDKVLDCWFESGSMPFAQFHYPFENVEKFEKNFPGDFIAEYVGQVRAWFYYLHAVNVGLFGKNAFKNVIVTGTIAGNDGRKMSKSFGNYTDPNELMDQYSADALRYLFLSSPLMSGEDFALIDKDVADISRKLAMVWNMYDFFTLYADVDQWDWEGVISDPFNDTTNSLDRWIISRTHQLIDEVTTQMDMYDVQAALKPIMPFIDDASNWYVRRSRKRFWKSDNDAAKSAAYKTLHYVLVQLARVLAPFTPFLSEELYMKLTGGKSVHLLDWPKVGFIDMQLIDDMRTVREYINEALALRAKSGIKVRQPLSKIVVAENGVSIDFTEMLIEELNVKSVEFASQSDVLLDFEITPELREEGLAREIIRAVQSMRKEAALEVDDRIALKISSHDRQITHVVSSQLETIETETLAKIHSQMINDAFTKIIKIEGIDVFISLAKM